jgi:hypothetical protein
MNVAVVHIVRSQCLEAGVQRFPVPVARLAVSRIQRVVSIETRVCVCYICLWSSPWMEIIANSPKVK